MNDSSVVLQIRYGDFVGLLTGDAEQVAEDEMIRDGRIESACFLKVGHHGSRSSTTRRFLEHVRPTVAAISCGRRNKFRHPHSQSLEALAAAGTEVHRTDHDGTLVFRTDGKRLEVVAEGVR